MWIIFALGSSISFSIVHLLDSYCVGSLYNKPYIGIIVSALVSSLPFAAIPFLHFEIVRDLFNSKIVLLGILSGILIQASQLLYFQSLKYSEAGIIAAYWNMVPVLLSIFSFTIFGVFFSVKQYSGLIFVICASIGICRMDSNMRSRWNSFLLMLNASLLQVVAYFSQSNLYLTASFVTGFFSINLGFFLFGICMLFIRKFRQEFMANWPILRGSLWLLLLTEIFNLLSIALREKAIQSQQVALVAGILATIPIFTFIFGVLYSFIFPRSKYLVVNHYFKTKLALSSFAAVGIYLIS